MANSQRLTPIQWTICVIAAIGFAFDTYELLMLPLVLPPALLEMLHVRARHAGVQPLARTAVFHSRARRRHVRSAGRLPDRSAWAGGAC